PSTGYEQLYTGLRIRPNLAATNGTPNDPTDDQILVATSNSTTAVTSSASITGVGSGDSFRSINIFDHFHLGDGAYVTSYGDLYSPGGSFGATSAATLVTGGLYSMKGNATFTYTGYENKTIALLDTAGGFGDTDLRSSGATLLSITIDTGNAVGVPPGTNLPPVWMDNSAALSSTGALSLASITMDSSSAVINTTSLTVLGAFYQPNGIITTDSLTAGSITMAGGIIRSILPTAGEIHRLSVTLSGNFVQTAGTLDTDGRGFKGYSFGDDTNGSTALRSVSYAGGSHGGMGGYSAAVGLTNVGPVYGDYRDPDQPGACNNGAYVGGGVIRLNVAGSCLVNGGIQASGLNGCAGGSIMVHCASITGTGNIYAYGGAASTSYGAGGGGRIALIVDGDASSLTGFFKMPTTQAEMLTLSQNVRFYGGSNSAGWGGGGGGTLFIKHSGSTYGNLILDKYTGTSNEWNGNTRMRALAGTVNAVPGATTLPISVTSNPGITASYANLYKGLRIRPNLGYNNGTSTNWADDGTVTISANSDTVLTMSSTMANVSNGDSFRSIDILDSIYVGNGVVLESAGDVYSLLGNPIANNSAVYSVPGIYLMEGAAGFTYPSYTNATAYDLRWGNATVTSLSSTGASLTAMTINGGTLTYNGNFTAPGGTITVTSSGALTVTGILSATNVYMESWSLTAPTINVASLYRHNGGTTTTSALTTVTYVQMAGTMTHNA
ncbi:MAG: hypothetical protein AAB425_10440, partial [Bdellovibrionota bacterium]